MLSIVIPTIQKNISVLNKLVSELVEEELIGEIIIIDNSLKGFTCNAEKVKVLTPETNLYVNPAWNFGIKNIKYEFFGILNDDILLPKNFCKQVYNFLKNNKNAGLIGLDDSIVKNTMPDDFEEYPPEADLIFSECKSHLSIRYWGSAIFGHKDNYYQIPEDIKVWCGDNFLLKKNKDNKKMNFKISGVEIKHLSSLSSGDPKFKKIKELDIHNYSKIDKAFKKCNKKHPTFLEKIFSVRNTDVKGEKTVYILWMHFKIRLARNNFTK